MVPDIEVEMSFMILVTLIAIFVYYYQKDFVEGFAYAFMLVTLLEYFNTYLKGITGVFGFRGVSARRTSKCP